VRNYRDTVAWVAEGIFGRYMNGSVNEYGGVDFQFVAFVYDKTPAEVENDIEREVEAMKKARFYPELGKKECLT
jgi:hypothetical protein